MLRGILVLAVVAVAVAAGYAEPRADGPRPATERSGASIATQVADALLVRLAPAEGLAGAIGAWGDVWANDYARGLVLRLDGRTGRVAARIRIGRRAVLAADRRNVWALRWGGQFWRRPNGPLYRIDPATNRIAERIPLRTPSGEQMVAFGVLAAERGVWVWGPSRVLRLDPTTGRVVREFEVDQRHGELTRAVLDGERLLAVRGDGALVRFCDRRGAREIAPRALAGAELLAIEGPSLLATVGGMLVAVERETGRLRWRRPLGFRVETVLVHRGVLLAQGSALGDRGDRIWALEPATGRVLASIVVPSFSTTAMAEVNGALWITTGAGEVVVVPRVLADLFVRRAQAQSTETHSGFALM